MKEKGKLHPNNKHQGQYDFEKLIKSCPELSSFVFENKYGKVSIDFFNPIAVKTLNKALLQHHYQVKNWDIPKNYLCPPIPSRADYIHYIADLLADSNKGKIPKGTQINCLDIGFGANCIYPILGHQIYNWSFVGSDIDPKAIASANQILAANPNLQQHIELRLQQQPQHIFTNLIQAKELFDVIICNPPFHASAEEAQAGSRRKIKNLKGKSTAKPKLNFGGQSNELWYEGGEKQFVKNMIKESKIYAHQYFWFSTLVSKESHLNYYYQLLEQARPTTFRTIEMQQGNKVSRLLVWTFLSAQRQKLWRDVRWK